MAYLSATRDLHGRKTCADTIGGIHEEANGNIVRLIQQFFCPVWSTYWLKYEQFTSHPEMAVCLSTEEGPLGSESKRSVRTHHFPLHIPLPNEVYSGRSCG